MIGKVIQEKRKQAGLTQAQLAELLGVSAPAVNRWEKDLSYPDTELLSPLARLLGTDLNVLFSFYDSLSEKERELTVDRARTMLLTESEEVALAYIENSLRQNLSDGRLFKEMGDMLQGMRFLRSADDPSIYLDKIAACYERALVLLPEQAEKIAYSLMTVYAELGDEEKAAEAFAQIPDKRVDKSWAQVELLFGTGKYAEAIPAIKEAVLREAVELAWKLDFLRDTGKKAEEGDLSDMAAQKASDLRALFGLWAGFNVMSEVTRSVSTRDAEAELAALQDFVKLDTRGKSLSDDPLFRDLKLGGVSRETASTADLMAEIMSALEKSANE